MRKGTKGMLIAAGIFAAAGIGLCVGGLSMGAASEGSQIMAQVVNSFRDNTYTGARLLHFEKIYKNTDSVMPTEEAISTELAFKKNLEISLKYDELILQEYNGDVIKADTFNDANGDVVITEDADKITIKDTHAGATRNKKLVKVSIPSGTAFDKVSLGVDAGTIELYGEIKADQFLVEVGAGEFDASATITADKCDLQVGAGTIDIETIDANEISANCGTGEIDMELSGKEQDYNYEISCGIGEVDVNDSEFSGLGVEKTITNDGAKRKVTLECGMGQIDVSFTNEE